MKKFDIVVFDGTRRREDHGVMSNSLKELAAIYSMTDEKIIEVIREYEDDDCKNYGKFDPNEILEKMNTPMAKGTMPPGSGMMRVSNDVQKIIDTTISTRTHDDSSADQSNATPSETPVPGYQTSTFPPIPGTADGLIPKKTHPAVQPMQSNSVFFNVGNVECKIENGIVYQKRWAPASETEMKRIRVVFDKTGKDIPMSGKHIEILKWEASNTDPTKEPLDSDLNVELRSH